MWSWESRGSAGPMSGRDGGEPFAQAPLASLPPSSIPTNMGPDTSPSVSVKTDPLSTASLSNFLTNPTAALARLISLSRPSLVC